MQGTNEMWYTEELTRTHADRMVLSGSVSSIQKQVGHGNTKAVESVPSSRRTLSIIDRIQIKDSVVPKSAWRRRTSGHLSGKKGIRRSRAQLERELGSVPASSFFTRYWTETGSFPNLPQNTLCACGRRKDGKRVWFDSSLLQASPFVSELRLRSPSTLSNPVLSTIYSRRLMMRLTQLLLPFHLLLSKAKV